MKLYFQRSKNLANSFLFIVPLLILYEVGIAIQGSSIKNTADVIIKTPLMVFGKNSSFIFNLFVIILLVVSLFYIEKEYRFSTLLFIPMFAESIIYALFIGNMLGFIVYKLLFPTPLANPLSLNNLNVWLEIILSIGAGVYEEIVFRFLLITSLYFVFSVLCKINKPTSIVISIFTASFLFTMMHYIGIFGDNFSYTNFTFRFLSGILLSAIFMFRGLGIAVYTHAIYDVLLVVRPFQV